MEQELENKSVRAWPPAEAVENNAFPKPAEGEAVGRDLKKRPKGEGDSRVAQEPSAAEPVQDEGDGA